MSQTISHAVTVTHPLALQAAAEARHVDWSKVLKLAVQYGQQVFAVIEAIIPLLKPDGTVDVPGLLLLAQKYGPEIVADILKLFGKSTVAPAA